MLYNPRNYQKSINKSIRLSQPVYDYIMQAPGDGFNQKFENIIIDAKESEARRQETLKMLDDRIEDLQADYNSCYDRLRKLAPMVQAALHINSLIKEFDSSVGKILEDARNVYLNRSSGSWQSAVKMRYNTFCISIPLQLRSDPRSAGVHFEIQELFYRKTQKPRRHHLRGL